jgi:hypothetical protein
MAENSADSGYVAVHGFDHDPSETRVEPGKPVPAGLPDDVIRQLVKQGAIKRGKATRRKGA